ncbi:MAG: hypothetical protein FJZ97_05285 [Chloroflexi bacterium]|nr:hypothetical protein [Chloroflexota bacterium]
MAFQTIAGQVQRLRGLETRHALEAEIVSPEDFAAQARAAFAAEWPDALLARQLQLDSFLGLVRVPILGGTEPERDAIGIFTAPDGAVFAADGWQPGPGDTALVACAFDRALVMQSLADRSSETLSRICPDDLDACLARRALVAGDAALLAEQWWRTFGGDRSILPASPVDCAAHLAERDEEMADISAWLGFPAEAGLAFVRTRYLAGGWAAVDAAHADPPLSSEQILHPERYPKDAPRSPDLDDLSPALGDGWTTTDSGVLGEWRTLLALRAYLEPDEAEKAAAGWGGDRYAILAGPASGAAAWLLLTRWDTVRDAHEFFGAFRTYGEGRFGVPRRTSTALLWELEAGVVLMQVGNDQTLWIQASSVEAADALRLASGFPLH